MKSTHPKSGRDDIYILENMKLKRGDLALIIRLDHFGGIPLFRI